MRELRAPYQPHRLHASDTLLLLRLDEGTDASDFVDEAGGGAFTQTGSPRRFAPVFSSALTSIGSGNGSRAFSSADYGTRAGEVTSRTVLQSNRVTVEAWIFVDNLAGSTHTIVCYGGNGGTQALNYLLWFGVTTDGRLRWEWERGAGTLYSGQTAAGVIAEDRVHHVALVRDVPSSGISSECNVHLYVDGEHVITSSNATLPNGGDDASVSWRVGADMVASRQAIARLDDIRVSRFAATDDAIRDSCARGRQAFDDTTAWSSGPSVHYRVIAYPANATDDSFDLTNLRGLDYVVDVSVSDDADASVQSARVTLRTGFSPFLSSSPFATNSVHMSGDPEVPLIAARIVIESATLPRGASRTAVGQNWRPLFEGFVTKIDVSAETVVVEASDLGVELQEAFIEPDRSGAPVLADYAHGSSVGVAVEGELQGIIDEQEPSAGWRARSHEILTRTSPSWNVYEFNTPPTMTVAQQLEDVVGSIGWLIRRRWDDHRVASLLQLYEPNRTATWTSGDLSLTSSDFIERPERLGVDTDAIRNVIEVEYGDASSTDPTGTIERATVLVSDATSIAKYGRRYARVGLGSTQRVNNLTQATEIANAILSDLKDPVADLDVTIPYRYHVEVGDMVRLVEDVRRYTFHGELDCAVVGVEHRLSSTDGCTTTLRLRQAKPAGWVARWLSTFVAGWGTVPSDGLSPPRAPQNLTATAVAGATLLRWTYPTNWLSRRYDATEVHASLSSGFTPSSSTLVGIVRGNSFLVGDQDGLDGTHYYKIVHRDRSANRSSASSQVSAVPLTALPSYRARVRSTAGGTTNYNTTPAAIESGLTTTEDYDVGSAMATSPWVYTVPVDGLYDIAALVIVATASTACRVMIYVDPGGGYVERAKGMLGTSESTVSTSLLLDAGDLVTLYITADATGRRIQAGSWFQVNYRMP